MNWIRKNPFKASLSASVFLGLCAALLALVGASAVAVGIVGIVAFVVGAAGPLAIQYDDD